MGDASLDRPLPTSRSPWSFPPGVLALSFGAFFLLAWTIAVSLREPGGIAARLAAIPAWGVDSWLEAAVRAATLGYTLVLPVLGERRAADCLEELAPLVQSSPDAPRAGLAAGRATRAAAAASGVLFTTALGFAAGSGGHGLDVIGVVWFAVIGALIGRALGAHFVLARSLSRVGSVIEIELLDLGPLAPLVRWGLRTVWLWVMWFALISLFWIGPGPPNWINALGLVPLLMIGLAALVIPVSGVHRHIVAAKEHALARLHADIRDEIASGGARRIGESPRLANLIAYRGLIEAVPEWPFDVPAISRFVFYVLLGAGSWVGAALVEHGVDQLFGGP